MEVGKEVMEVKGRWRYIYLYIYEWKDAIRLGGESGVGRDAANTGPTQCHTLIIQVSHNALKYIQKTPGLLL